jgi:hypothetical protein
MQIQTSRTRRYWLAQHVFVCRSGANVVLLDLARDRYIGVPGAAMDALAGTLAGWQATAPAAPTGEDVIQRMLSAGMLKPDERSGKPAVPVIFARAERALIEGYRKQPLSITPTDVFRFVASVVSARRQLRRLPLETVVNRARANHCSTSGPAPASAAPVSAFVCPSSESPYFREMRSLVHVFRRLRPFLFTAYDACLLDSLALRIFLGRYGFRPSWLFGVKSTPFAAHCWLQLGATVINDTPEHVRLYEPIMVVP